MKILTPKQSKIFKLEEAIGKIDNLLENNFYTQSKYMQLEQYKNKLLKEIQKRK